MKVLLGLKSELKVGLVNLPTPLTINYWWGFGVSLGVVYVFQILSGVVLSMFYSISEGEGGYSSVVFIMNDVKWGWLVRMVHCGGVSLYFFLMYMHIFRGFMYGGFKHSSVWFWGMLVFSLSILVAFMGYVLPWGSMSYWGMVVVTSVIGVIPGFGSGLMELLWGSSAMPGGFSLPRYFSLHYMLSLGVGLVVLFHMLELHEVGSSNPLGVSGSVGDRLAFHESFTYKDAVMLWVVFAMYWWLVLVDPHLIMEAVNYEEVDMMKTPSHIKPEWYFLFLYCVLRSIPSKMGGVVVMGLAVFMVWGFSYFAGFSGRSAGGLEFKVGFLGLFVSGLLLSILGGKVVEYPYQELGGAFVVVYFFGVFIMWHSLVRNVWALC